jgi:hypothetical protein
VSNALENDTYHILFSDIPNASSLMKDMRILGVGGKKTV